MESWLQTNLNGGVVDIYSGDFIPEIFGGLYMIYGLTIMLGLTSTIMFLEEPNALVKRSLLKSLELFLAWA